MSLLLPDAGLLFWMLLSFGIVFLVLYKYGFPVIISMLDERRQFIDESLRNAAEANRKLELVEQEREAILNSAREEQARMLRETSNTREQMLAEARKNATAESEKLIADARKTIKQEKEDALREVHAQVAELSLAIAGKIIRRELSTDERQQAYTKEMVDEALVPKDNKE